MRRLQAFEALDGVDVVVLAVGLFVLFDKILDVPLPLGILSSLEI